jgi:hypothetical protein
MSYRNRRLFLLFVLLVSYFYAVASAWLVFLAFLSFNSTVARKTIHAEYSSTTHLCTCEKKCSGVKVESSHIAMSRTLADHL